MNDLFTPPTLGEFAYFNRARLEADYIGIRGGVLDRTEQGNSLVLHERAHSHLSLTSVVGVQYLVTWGFGVYTLMEHTLLGGPERVVQMNEWRSRYLTKAEAAPGADPYGAQTNLAVAALWGRYVLCHPFPHESQVAAEIRHIDRVAVSEIQATPFMERGDWTVFPVPILSVWSDSPERSASTAVGEHALQELGATLLQMRYEHGPSTIAEAYQRSAEALAEGRADPFTAGLLQFFATISHETLADWPAITVEVLVHSALTAAGNLDGALLAGAEPDELGGSYPPRVGQTFIEVVRDLALAVEGRDVEITVPKVANFFARSIRYPSWADIAEKAERYVASAVALLRSDDFRGTWSDRFLRPILETSSRDRTRQRSDFAQYLEDLPHRLLNADDVCLPWERFDDGPGPAPTGSPLQAILIARLFDGIVNRSEVECMYAEEGVCSVGGDSVLTPHITRRSFSLPVSGYLPAACTCPGLYEALGLGGRRWQAEQAEART